MRLDARSLCSTPTTSSSQALALRKRHENISMQLYVCEWYNIIHMGSLFLIFILLLEHAKLCLALNA